MMKHSVAMTIGVAAAACLISGGNVFAASATGTASVRIVSPLSVTEVSSSSFEYTNTSNEMDRENVSTSLVVRSSPHAEPITAKSHSDPIKWGEFTLSGKNYAQVQVSSVNNMPAEIQFSGEKAMVGDVAIQVNSSKSASVDLSKPQKLALYSAMNIKKDDLVGRYQPTYTIALHYE